MILDAELMFSNKQPLTGGVSQNILRVGPGDVGKGEPLTLVVVTSGATGALTVALETSDAEDMSGNVTPAAYAVDANRVQAGGLVVAQKLPVGCKKYLRLNYTTAAAGGTVTAGLALDAQTNPGP